VPHDRRDQIVDFVRRWSDKTEIGAGRFLGWLNMTASKFYAWRERYGQLNAHNGWVPRDFWLEAWEKQAIMNFHLKNPLEGYRRLTFMMLDRDVVAVSPASVWRVLSRAGLLRKWNGKPSRKGAGFEQPLGAHQHWHTDVSYINICGTFYYLCSVLVLLCYKRNEQQKGQQGSCRIRARAILMRSVAMDCRLCRSARTRRAAGLELGRNPRRA
jgi:hypothetical protein